MHLCLWKAFYITNNPICHICLYSSAWINVLVVGCFCCWFRAAGWQPASGSAHFKKNKKLPRWCITTYSLALKQVCCICLQHLHPDHPSIPIEKRGHLWLAVVLQGHGDDIYTDDKGDDKVQVVAGTQSVDSQPGWTVWRVVGQLLGFWEQKKSRKKQEKEKNKSRRAFDWEEKVLMKGINRWKKSI